MAKVIDDKEEKKHVHFWRQGYNESERKCECGKILISQQEFDRREEEWNAYYAMCRTTPSYFDFVAMGQAFKKHDLVQVEEIMARIKERTEIRMNEHGDEVRYLKESLPKPNCPDPSGGMYITAS